ncbi:MAG: ABC transporter ATP-binding protein [Acidimicrobiales bacterium]|nr:ABC transporter ATP-binding protein [Acidimicrobiales bacterium]
MSAKRKRTEEPEVIPAVRTVGLAKDYGDLVALAPLDLSVPPGQSLVLVGHNGSGKTTLLRLTAGLLEATDGSVEIAGAEAGTIAARAVTSYLPDNPVLYDDLSVWEHAEYIARLHGVDDWEGWTAELLGRLGLSHRADDLPSTFSRGLRQKTSILLSLVRPFSVLLVDEPFVGLDAGGKEALLGLLREVHAEGATLVVATHELAFVDMVDRCVALREGEVIHDGPTDGIDVLSLVS